MIHGHQGNGHSLTSVSAPSDGNTVHTCVEEANPLWHCYVGQYATDSDADVAFSDECTPNAWLSCCQRSWRVKFVQGTVALVRLAVAGAALLILPGLYTRGDTGGLRLKPVEVVSWSREYVMVGQSQSASINAPVPVCRCQSASACAIEPGRYNLSIGTFTPGVDTFTPVNFLAHIKVLPPSLHTDPSPTSVTGAGGNVLEQCRPLVDCGGESCNTRVRTQAGEVGALILVVVSETDPHGGYSSCLWIVVGAVVGVVCCLLFVALFFLKIVCFIVKAIFLL